VSLAPASRPIRYLIFGRPRTWEAFKRVKANHGASAGRRTITTLEASIADLRSLLAKAEGRAADERSRCDRLIAETLAANTRAVHLEGELTALVLSGHSSGGGLCG
jgi:hypothetical protein